MSSTPAKLCALLLVLVVSACATLTPHQKAYAVGAIAKTVVEEADHEFWDPLVRAKTAECDPANNTKVETKQDFDACLGVARFDEKVAAGLEVYGTTAGALFVLLKSTESDEASITSAKKKMLDAAFAVLNEMGPQAKSYVNNLKALTRGK